MLKGQGMVSMAFSDKKNHACMCLQKMDANFENWKTLAENLGFTPDFLMFIKSKVGQQKLLCSTNFCEDFNGSVTITLEYKSPSKSGKNSNAGKPLNKKHKTPSQRRRDRERFRKWLEKKKKRGKPDILNQAVISTPPKSSPEPAMPVSPTVSQTSQSPPPDPPDSPASPVRVSNPCYCARFDPDKEPFSDYKYFCGFPDCELNADRINLKTCTQCRMVAYCSREHQSGDWPNHKEICHPEEGEHVMERIDQWKQWKAGMHHCPYQSS